MSQRISSRTISQIKVLRSQGWSLPDLKNKFQIGYGTVHRYTQDVEILPQYKKYWLEKKKSSVTRMKLGKTEAKEKAQKIVFRLNSKEKLLLLSFLYWAEGNKKDFSFINSDPQMIKFFVQTLVNVLNIPKVRIKLNIRVYEGMNNEVCKEFWSTLTGLDESNMGKTNIVYGKKHGKLEFGLCRVRVIKGGSVLKYLTALKDQALKIASL